ncbi:hypothetical protein CXB36_23440 [Pseudomonas syringae pv. syringae]|nr:hypothetical protein CXB36_23440 [Pseudomonas syringae pv. syringae]
MSGLGVPFIGIETPMVIAKCYWRPIIGMLLQRGQPDTAEQGFRCWGKQQNRSTSCPPDLSYCSIRPSEILRFHSIDKKLVW